MKVSEKTRISVIMPVHNRGKLVREAIEDIVTQDFLDFEIICVDDGSDEDEVLSVLSEYKDRYSFIKVIRMGSQNGAARARNKGIDNATGEYVLFVDSDDRFDKELLKITYDVAVDEKADVCLFGYRQLDVRTGLIQARGLYRELIDDKDRNEHFFVDIFMNPCKLFRRKFLLENKVRFQDIKSSNDYAFVIISLVMANGISLAGNGRPLFTYRLGLDDQISKRRDCRNVFKAYTFAKDFLEKHEKNTPFLSLQQLAKLMLSGIYEIKREGTVYRDKLYLEIRQELIKEKPVFETESLNIIRDYFIDHANDMKWIELTGDFFTQLKNNEVELMNELQEYNPLIIWGNGKRSYALQKLLKEKDINLSVCETGDRNVGNYTEMGYLIVSTKDVLDAFGLIIASTEEVFRCVNEEDSNKHRIINLSFYCPLG